ncbi:MAG: hypothetical protein R3F49_04015 [Planctomycetota bacterium]
MNLRRGTALVGALVVFMGIAGLVAATTTFTQVELGASRRSFDSLRAEALAEAGIERAKHLVGDALSKTSVYDPLWGVTSLFQGEDSLAAFHGEPIVSGGARVGACSVTLELLAQNADEVTVRVTSTGYVPDAPENLPQGRAPEAWASVEVTLRYTVAPSRVFDNAYFINNWGWFYGNTILCNGNARSNGQFDCAGYSPLITGQPIYEGANVSGSGATLSGYQDDNGDGLMDGNDGGVFSAWDIRAAQNVRGNGGDVENQHDYEDAVEMPNLTDLSRVEERAIAAGGGVTIAGAAMTNAVYGDEGGELENLYLVGTAANPIVIDGKVVVRGDLVISGYVSGQGAIYAGGNVYVPNSLQYVDGPTTPRPASNSQADTEAWLTANQNKDFLGLFAREHVVVGDHTHWLWRQYVSGWMSSSMNGSAEDAGEDGIPNTTAGRDGILGTADDDVLEGDGVFTTEYYTAEDDARGLIPPGHSIGDRVPGTGEDIDGDGEFDSTTTLADIDFDDALDPAFWGGNIPPGGVPSYDSIASLYANHLDAAFYTNHSFSYVVLGSQAAEINGAVISRNENIVYGTPSVAMNYDSRMLGGNSSLTADLLPRVAAAVEVVSWRVLTEDPHRIVTP